MTRQQRDFGRTHLLDGFASGTRVVDSAVVFVDKHQLTYQEIDIETTPGAAQEVIRRTGKRAIPQLVIDGEWFQPYRPGEGFLYEEMSERLGLTQ